MRFCVWLHHSWDILQSNVESSGEAQLPVTLNRTWTPGLDREMSVRERDRRTSSLFSQGNKLDVRLHEV